jgi:hypothetical protein
MDLIYDRSHWHTLMVLWVPKKATNFLIMRSIMRFRERNLPNGVHSLITLSWIFFPTNSSLLRDRLSERKPVSFAELGPCFLFGSRRRNSFVKRCTSLFNWKGGSAPGVSTNTLLRYSHESQAALFTGPPTFIQRIAYFSEYGVFKSILTHLTWDVGGTKM